MINLKQKYTYNRSSISSISEFLEIAIIVFALSWFLKTYLIHFMLIDHNSMIPALIKNDRVCVLKGNESLERGDVVVYNTEDDKSIVKRIIGLPGEIIEVRDGHTYINQKPIYEPYVRQKNLDFRIEPQEVPGNSVFLLHDNRKTEAAKGYLIPHHKIKGRLILRYWPLIRVSVF